MRLLKAALVIAVVLIADQVLKVWVKQNMFLGEEFSVIGNWFLFHFTENNGIAFGLELGGRTGKLLLTIFRLVALVLIGVYLGFLIKKKAPTALIISISLIWAGAAGNIIDSVFYGVIFQEINHYQGGWLHGRVVDMFFFPLIEGTYPEWFPFVGGNYFMFFRPVFNIADSAITVGVLSILLFQRKMFKDL